MEIKTAIKRQHRAALQMMRELIESTPEDLWLSGEHPRSYWRVAYHALGYTHLYLYEDLASWKAWGKARNHCAVLEGEVEFAEPYTKADLLELTDLILSELDGRVDSLDLDAPTCGFTWYPGVSQVELLLLNLRHLHGHLGQLHELLLGRGIDVEWLGEPK